MRRWVTLWRDGEYGMTPVEVYMMDFDEIAWDETLAGEEVPRG